MLESNLWKYLKPELKKVGKFQKISDRFTPGIPDVLGCWGGVGWALELKVLKGSRTVKVDYRPGQIDWLLDWSDSGGRSLVLASRGLQVWAIPPQTAGSLEYGIPGGDLLKISTIYFRKTPRNKWGDFVKLMKDLT